MIWMFLRVGWNGFVLCKLIGLVVLKGWRLVLVLKGYRIRGLLCLLFVLIFLLG